MFKLVKTLTTWWPVKVYEPDPENPGSFLPFEFEAEFEILDRDEVKKNQQDRAALFVEYEAETGEQRLAELQDKLDALQERDFLRVVRNWRGVVDDSEKPVLFSEQMLLQALKRNHVREGIAAAYAEAIDTGKARQGN